MTAIISRRATTTSPIVPAKESNILSQYSPAPVVNSNPIKKQNVQTTPVLLCIGEQVIDVINYYLSILRGFYH